MSSKRPGAAVIRSSPDAVTKPATADHGIDQRLRHARTIARCADALLQSSRPEEAGGFSDDQFAAAWEAARMRCGYDESYRFDV